jgi:hypothetical protein
LKKARIRLREVEIIALAGMTAENVDGLKGLVKSYRGMLFPGVEKDDADEDQLAQMRRVLAEETKKAFIVKPVSLDKAMETAGKTTNPNMAKLAGRAAAEAERQKLAKAEREQRARQQARRARARLLNPRSRR